MFATEAIERAPALHRRGAPSDRGDGASEPHLLPWLSRRVGTTLRAPDLEGVRPEAARRPAAARRRRPGGAVHVRERQRRALHALLRQDHGSRAPRSATQIATAFGGCTGSKRLRLGGERARRHATGCQGHRAGGSTSRLDRAAPSSDVTPAPASISIAKISSCSCGADRRASVAPAASSALRARHRRLRQHDAHGREEIAGAVLGRQALALEAEGAARNWCRPGSQARPRRRASARAPCRRAPPRRA